MGSVNAKSSARRRLVFVLGMHRSGTSMITRLINLAGAALPRNLMAAREDNESGYWEAVGGMVLNDAILAAAGLGWNSVREIPDGWFQSREARPFGKRIADLLDQELRDSPLAVFKDPRISRLFPLWREVAEKSGWTCSAVLMLRDPREVAESLYLRNGLSRPAAGILWLRYVLEAERASRDIQRVVVSYDETLNDWRAVLDRVATGLGIFDGSLPAEIANEADAFVSVDHKHHAVLTGAGGVPEIAVRLYREMTDPEGDPARLQAFLDRIFASMKALGPLLPPVLEAADNGGAGQEVVWAEVLDSLLGWRTAEPEKQERKSWDASDGMLAEALERARVRERLLDDECAANEALERALAQKEAKLAAQAKVIRDAQLTVAETRSRLEYVQFVERELEAKTVQQAEEIKRLSDNQAALTSELAVHEAAAKLREEHIVRWAIDRQQFDHSPGFDEIAYLNANPDVRQLVEKGELRNGFEHWAKWGFREGRRAWFLPTADSDGVAVRPA